jgi:hypothetical protein
MRTKKTKRQVTGLTWDNFDWGCFQTMSVYLGETAFPDCNFDPYLKQGQKQDGQDLMAFSRKNGKFLGLQCKREKTLGPADIDSIINEMLIGYYADKLSDFILVTSADLESIKIRRHINDWKVKLLAEQGILFDCWDRPIIEEQLRKQWSIVEYYFGGSEADKFCYKQLKHAGFENIVKLNGYIPRTVSKQINSGDENDMLNFWRHFDRKSVDLKDVFLEDRLTTKRICLIGHSHFGKSFYIRYSAYELKNAGCRIQPILLEIGKYSIQPIETLLDTLYGAWKNIPYNDLLIIIDGLDEVPFEDFNEVLKHINEFSQAHRNLNILVSCRTVFFNRYNAAGILSLFEVYEFNQYDYEGIRLYLQTELGTELAAAFENDISKFNLRALLFQPFYLINLAEEYAKPPHKLPGGRIQVLERCVEKSFHHSRARQTKGSDNIGLSISHFKKLIAHFAFALQLAGRNSFTEEEMESLFSLEDRSLLQHNPLITIVGNSWSFTNALYQEHLAASLLAKMSLPEIKKLIAFGQVYPKVKTKWIQTVSSLLSFFEPGDELFDQLLKFIEDDNIEIIFQTESSKFSPDMQLVFIKKFMTNCREQNIRPVMVYEDYIGGFLENNKAAGDYLIEQIEDSGAPNIVKTVAARVLANMKINSSQKDRFKGIALKEISNTTDASYAGELIEVFSKFGIGDQDTIKTLLGMDRLVNSHPFRDSVYELIRILKLTDDFYQFGLEGIPAFLEYNKSTSHGGSETNLQDLLLATRKPKNLKKLLQKNPSADSFTYIDYMGSHKETFLRRLFDIYVEVYKIYPSVIIPISDFVRQVGKRYLRDEMNDIDRFLDKTGTHGLVVRRLVKDLMEDNDWEIGGLITPELYDYIFFEYEEGGYSSQSLRNCWIGMRHKQKEKTDIDFYKLCDDVVGGEFERQEKSGDFTKYQQAEIKRRQNDAAVIGSLAKFKRGIRRYFKSFGKKSLSDEDLMIDTDFRAIRVNADSYLIFNYLLHDAPRQNTVIYQSKCLKHLDQPEFFEFFRANQILKYSFQDEEGKEILLSYLKTFYYEYLKKANFVNCIEIKNDRYFHRPLPVMLGDIFTKFGLETDEKYLLDFLWLDTGGTRNFAKGYHHQQSSFSHKIIELIPANKIERLKQKVVENMRTGINHEMILGNHISLCKKYSITEVNDVILDAIYNAGSGSTMRGDATEIYLELGGDAEKIFELFRNYTSMQTYDFFWLAAIVAKINPPLVIEKVSQAVESDSMPESLRVHHAELLMELGAWKGFAILTRELRLKKRALEHMARGRNVARIDTQSVLDELEDMIYLMVDPLYNNRNSIHDTAGHIVIDWLYQLAAKSEHDLELVTSYLAKSRDSLLPKYPNSVSTFNWMIKYMTEKHRDSDKTIRSPKEIKQIIAQLNE